MTYVAYFPHYGAYMKAREELLYGCYLVSQKASKEAYVKTCFDKLVGSVRPVNDKILETLYDDNNFTWDIVGEFNSVEEARKAYIDNIERDCADRDIGW